MAFFSLFLAAALFVWGHLALSSNLIRPKLVERLGETGFMGIYSLVAIISFIWMLYAYGGVDHSIYLWTPGLLSRLAAWIILPLAFTLLVISFSTKNPTAVGQDGLLTGVEGVPSTLAITRHPMAWGIALYSAQHIWMNGDVAAIILFGSLLIVAVMGAYAIDSKRREKHGEHWHHFAAQTSNFPFVAIVSGRAKLSLADLGYWRIGVGFGTFVLAMVFHTSLSGGVPLF